jgi:predicted nucleic acid-binding protein
MIHLDTSALIAALSGQRREVSMLRRLVADGERLGVSSIVLYEWWRGPRTEGELEVQETLVPSRSACEFGVAQAALAAAIYRRLNRPRRRAIDLAIAACAISQHAALWTLNPRDFSDIPDLELVLAA